MTLAGVCVALAIAVTPPAWDKDGEVELHTYTFCIPGVYLDTREVRVVTDATDCEYAGYQFIHSLQMAGELPGSLSRIYYTIECENSL